MFIRPEYLPEGSMAACNSCGAIALLAYAVGWRSFRSFAPPGLKVVQHHCPRCVERNELVRSGLVYRVPTDTAVQYEEVTHG